MSGRPTRRRLLRAGLSVGLTGVAGCAGVPHSRRATGASPAPETAEPSSEREPGGTTEPPRSEAGAPGTAEAWPVLRNLGVEFGPYDEETGMAGDFRFSEDVFALERLYPTMGGKVFLEFGGRIESEGDVKRSPEFLYIVDGGTIVRSAIDGVVRHVDELYSGDVGVTLAADAGSAWMVTHEHVADPTVTAGDEVTAGQPLADVSSVDLEGTGFGWTELSVWKGGATEEDIVKICPFSALAEERKPAYAERIERFVAHWEAFAGEDVYDEGSWVTHGCRFAELTEAEALNPDG